MQTRAAIKNEPTINEENRRLSDDSTTEKSKENKRNYWKKNWVESKLIFIFCFLVINFLLKEVPLEEKIRSKLSINKLNVAICNKKNCSGATT